MIGTLHWQLDITGLFNAPANNESTKQKISLLCPVHNSGVHQVFQQNEWLSIFRNCSIASRDESENRSQFVRSQPDQVIESVIRFQLIAYRLL